MRGGDVRPARAATTWRGEAATTRLWIDGSSRRAPAKLNGLGGHAAVSFSRGTGTPVFHSQCSGPIRWRYEPRRVRRFSMMTGSLCRDDCITRRRAAGRGRGEGSSSDASASLTADSSSIPDSRSTTSSLPTSTTSTSMAPMKVRCPTLRVRVSMVGLYHEV